MRRSNSTRIILALLTLAGLSYFGSSAGAETLRVQPSTVLLDRPEASQQLLISRLVEGRWVDVSRDSRFELTDPELLTIDDRGLIRPQADGETRVTIHHDGEQVELPVMVRDLRSPQPVSFANEVIPILTKARCNSGGCHGKAEGQNGFQLSVFGFDAEADYASLVKEGRGRRIELRDPNQSLLLLKGTAAMPHGGGRKIESGSAPHRRMLRWISEGARFNTSEDESTRVVSIEVEPSHQVLLAGETQQVRVTAVEASGHRRCVTIEADYESNSPVIAEVDERGLIQVGDVPGEAVILVRYLGHVATSRITLPRSGIQFERPAEANFIDHHVWNRLERLGIAPSGPADDAMFLRRVFLDTIGTLPTAAEARSFLLDSDPDKRARLIDELLERPEYADYWTMRWLDLLRADQLKVTPQGTVGLQRWLRRQFVENRPYDEFVHEILTVQGNTVGEGPAAFYKAITQPDELSRSISQLFLGVRIECAQCHHHPSERWGQDDYAALAGFFTGIQRKKLPTGDDAIFSRGGNDVPHPRTGEPVTARALGADPADFSNVVDRRVPLADWMTSADNPYFARAIVNRLWAHYLGRGLIEPIDDLRDTNPATNEPLMQALVDHLVEQRFDLKALTRVILNSNVYQLSSQSNPSNRDDEQNFSRAAYKSLPAEVLLDAICQSTGVPEKFNGWPEGYRAIQVWDNRMPSYFFRIFGRPVRATVCECERSNEPSISQALHLLNSSEIMAKLQHRNGTVRQLAQSDLSEKEIIEELYLGTLSRFPHEADHKLMLQAFAEPELSRQEAIEDVLWALLNSKDYLFNR